MAQKILVIDDDENIRLMLNQMLTNAGYSVVEAQNGQVGVEKFQQEQFDLVVTDLIMPEKEGVETIRELKQINFDIKIIAISGGGSIAPQEYLLLAKRFGVVQTFEKPFHKNEFLEAVNQLL